MGTKLKNWNRSPWSKAVAWLLAWVLIGTAAWAAWMGIMQGIIPYADDRDLTNITQLIVNPNEWMEDEKTDQQLVAYSLMQMGNFYESVENIQSGATVDDARVAQQLIEEYRENMDEEEATSPNDTSTDKGLLTDQEIQRLSSEIQYQLYQNYGSDINYDEMIVWLKNNRGAYEIARDSVIEEDLSDWNSLEWNLKRTTSQYFFYASKSKKVFTNVSFEKGTTAREVKNQLIDEAAVYLTYDNENKEWVQKKGTESVYQAEFNLYAYPIRSGDILLVSMSQEQFADISSVVDVVTSVIYRDFVLCVGCLLGALLCLIFLMFGAGRTQYDNEIHLCGFDRIWTEVQLIALGCLLIPVVCGIQLEANAYGTELWNNTQDKIMAAWVVFAIVSTTLFALVVLSQVRRIKARQWLNGFVCWRIVKWVWSVFKRAALWLLVQFRRGPLYVRALAVCICVPLLCIFPPFAILAAVVSCICSMRMLERFMKIKDGAARIRNGETGLHVEVEGGKELKELADDLSGISEGLEQAVEDAVKSERMKSELISNVSHDIKTPLTGIITYVDLLKECNLQDETARSYVDVIDRKAQRLKVLTTDLFEAAKASSGAMKVEFERLDLDALLRQAIGESNQKLAKNHLTLRVTSKKTEIRADGRHMWRILDNMLVNCSRYAQPNSRVYVDVTTQDGMAVLTMKNISANELNIPAEELMQRFTRGDAARTSEGSGLGLSIASNLAKLMNGSFEISVDGDLFKAEVRIPLWK